MTTRAIQALEVLAAGGYFRKALETGWFAGSEKFATRLYPADVAAPHRRVAVRGFGYATLRELEDAGLVKSRACETSSLWPEEWEISEKGRSALERRAA